MKRTMSRTPGYYSTQDQCNIKENRLKSIEAKDAFARVLLIVPNVRIQVSDNLDLLEQKLRRHNATCHRTACE